MTKSEMIRAVCKAQKVPLAELCRRIGTTPQLFNTKLNRNTVTFEVMKKIAFVLGVGYEQIFLFPDGEWIGTVFDSITPDGTVPSVDFLEQMKYNQPCLMTSSEMIRSACKKKKIRLYKISERIGLSPTNFCVKLRRNTVPLEGMAAVAKALGIVYRHYFILPDGQKIGMSSEE